MRKLQHATGDFFDQNNAGTAELSFRMATNILRATVSRSTDFGPTYHRCIFRSVRQVEGVECEREIEFTVLWSTVCDTVGMQAECLPPDAW